jgi:hypothetical protein
MMSKAVWLMALLGSTLFGAANVRAQDATVPSTEPRLFKFDMFDFNTNAVAEQPWLAETQATAMTALDNRHVTLYGVTGGVGYYVFNNIAFVLDASGYGFNEGHSNGAAVAAALGLRHHIFTIDRSRFYLQVAGGVIEASNNIPAGGTHLNNTIQFGMGVQHPIGENVYLNVALDYFHISNARSEGPARNPSANGLQGIVGVVWRF